MAYTVLSYFDSYINFYRLLLFQILARISQSVQRLAMDWTVRGSNSGGRRDFPHLSRPTLRPTQSLIEMLPGLLPGVRRPGRDFDPTLI